MRDTDDNLIDWSAFDEAEETAVELDGSRQLRIVSGILLLIAAVGIVMGGLGFGEALNTINSLDPTEGVMDSGVSRAGVGIGTLAQPCFLIFFGFLTIIPAAFGLQTAKSPVVFVAPTVLGLLGIVVSVICAVALLVIQALAGEFDPVIPSYFIVCALVAVAYLFFVVRVHKAANAKGDIKRRPTKDELWDDKNVWG